MTRAQALALLQVWRPGGRDADDPRLAEALKLVDQDPELARRLAAQQAFDAAVAAQMRALPVPNQLRAALLKQAPRPRLPFWQRDLLPLLRRPALRWGFAVLAALLAGLGGRKALEGPPTFADYRREVLEEAWGANPHLEFRSSDIERIEQWVRQRGVDRRELLPSALAGMKILGCRLVNWRGHDVVLLCLLDGPQHHHLFISEGIDFPDPPWGDKPDYESFGRRRTAAWSTGQRAYVLEGMKYIEFTKRFLRDGVWRFSG